MKRPVALSIAGSDSGGGAGLQVDTRTFVRLGAFATTAVTAVTAQNLSGVRAVAGLPAQIVRAQVGAVMDEFAVSGVKTGMLWSADTVYAVAEELRARGVRHLVVDPVMVATSGSQLLQRDGLTAYRDALIPLCSLLTPNLDEARALLGSDVAETAQMGPCAQELAAQLGCSVLLKGGHLDGPPLDVLCHDGRLYRWQHPRLQGVNTHGSGCMLSSAITALLAHGVPLQRACHEGIAFVHDALARACTPAGTEQALANVEQALTTVSHLRPIDDA